MKKYILFILFLLNLLPNMNIRTGSICVGWSTLSAQQMGNENAYYCYDDEIGWYYTPISCDDEVCHQACRIKDKYGLDCSWEGDCDEFDFHMQVEHSNYDDDKNDNDKDDSDNSSNNDNYAGGGGGSSSGWSHSGNGGTGNNGSGTPNSQFYNPRKNDVLLKDTMKIQWKKQKEKNECVTVAMDYAAELTRNQIDGNAWFKTIYMGLYKKNVEKTGVLLSHMDDFIGKIFLYNIVDSGESLRNAIDNHHPVLATIRIGTNPAHEVLIVGYNTVLSNTVVYICINPSSGEYEDHTYNDFQKGNYHKYEIIDFISIYNSRRINL